MEKRVLRDLAGHIVRENNEPVEQGQIVYEFVPQPFLLAYVEAWKRWNEGNYKPYFLVIEEINRGNCAQVFGDIFQLLDRNENGSSRYAITPNQDIKRHLRKELSTCENLSEPIRSGEEMRLPSNLYIWATMNTSDQSLFPIDSAFKRRWDWHYIPISQGKDKKTKNALHWSIEVNGLSYDWWDFVQKVNKEIYRFTSSEDKKLGFFFALAKDNIIDVQTLVYKVYFYLWNDVFKDEGFSDPIFRDENDGELLFTRFFTDEGTIDEANAARFLENLKVKSFNKGETTV